MPERETHVSEEMACGHHRIRTGDQVKKLIIGFRCVKHDTALEMIALNGLFMCPPMFGTVVMGTGWPFHFQCPMDGSDDHCTPADDWNWTHEVIGA